MDITNYTDLQPIVFQALREVGNTTIVCFLLEQALVSSCNRCKFCVLFTSLAKEVMFLVALVS